MRRMPMLMAGSLLSAGVGSALAEDASDTVAPPASAVEPTSSVSANTAVASRTDAASAAALASGASDTAAGAVAVPAS